MHRGRGVRIGGEGGGGSVHRGRGVCIGGEGGGRSVHRRGRGRGSV